MPDDYLAVLGDLKRRIAAAQTRAALAVSRELMALYWHVGRTIVQRQAQTGWGEAVVERLAHDLRQAFPDLEGFSPRNIWRMRAFFLAWSGSPKKLTQAVSEIGTWVTPKKLPQAVSEIPWGHNVVLLQQLTTADQRLWYAEQARLHGWSRQSLQAQIAKKVHSRQGKATSNFARALPAPQSQLAQQALKDPYTFDFLTIGTQGHRHRADYQGAHQRDHRLDPAGKRAGENPGHRETHPEQVRLSPGPAGRGGQNRAQAGRAALRGLGVGEKPWKPSGRRGTRRGSSGSPAAALRWRRNA
jgi:predicted nuclease of restriction endonuclease-like (RecB) superfamily